MDASVEADAEAGPGCKRKQQCQHCLYTAMYVTMKAVTYHLERL